MAGELHVPLRGDLRRVGAADEAERRIVGVEIAGGPDAVDDFLHARRHGAEEIGFEGEAIGVEAGQVELPAAVGCRLPGACGGKQRLTVDCL